MGICCRNSYKVRSDSLEMNRKGELTSSQIIGIVIALAGFLILLFFISLLADDSSQQDVELCRLSVLTRATAPTAAQAAVPLKCTTGKICLSESGNKEDCAQFNGEKDVRVVKIEGKTDEEKANMINRVLADSMYQCWSMMGQGKLDIFGKSSYLVGEQGDASCVICSRIALAKVSSGVRDRVNLENYLETNSPSEGSPTYLKIFSQDSGAETFAGINKDIKIGVDSDTNLNGASNDQIAFVFSQTKTKEWQTVLEHLAVGGAFFTFTGSQIPGVGGALGAFVFSKAGLVSVAASTVAVGFIGVRAYLGQQAAAGYCGEFTTSAEKLTGGCSIVQAVNYNVQDINKLCKAGIQGNP